MKGEEPGGSHDVVRKGMLWDRVLFGTNEGRNLEKRTKEETGVLIPATNRPKKKGLQNEKGKPPPGDTVRGS